MIDVYIILSYWLLRLTLQRDSDQGLNIALKSKHMYKTKNYKWKYVVPADIAIIVSVYLNVNFLP